MSNPLNTVFVDLVGPPVSAAWLNAVGAALNGTTTPTTITATAGNTAFMRQNTFVNLTTQGNSIGLYGAAIALL
jgi:hypothetical protein